MNIQHGQHTVRNIRRVKADHPEGKDPEEEKSEGQSEEKERESGGKRGHKRPKKNKEKDGDQEKEEGSKEGMQGESKDSVEKSPEAEKVIERNAVMPPESENQLINSMLVLPSEE